MPRGALLLLLLLSCREGAPPVLALRLEGASAVERVDGGERAWFDEPEAPWVRVDGAASFEWVPGGSATVTETREGAVGLARPGAGEFELVVKAGEAVARRRLVFRESSNGIIARFAERARGDLAAARRALDDVAPHEWPWACVGVARETPLEQRADAFATCADGAGARGFVSESLNRRIAAVYWARRLRQSARLRALVAQVERELAAWPDERLAATFHYQQGVGHAESGALREAEVVLGRAIAEAERAHRPGEASLYRAYVAVVQSESGRHAEALQMLGTLAGSEALSPQNQRVVRSNAAWVRLRAHAHGATGVEPDALRRELQSLASVADPLEASNVLSNLAWLELVEGRTAQARQALADARARSGGAQTVEAVFLDWLDGRLALASGDDVAARRAFESMLKLEPLTADRAPEAAWRARLGLAEAWLLRGRQVEAERELSEARRALSTQARAFGEPRERVVFLQDRRHAISDAVDAFVRAGRCELAWRFADDAQAWLARSFEADRRVRLARLDAAARGAFETDEERWAAAREALLAEEPPSLASVPELEAWKRDRAERYARLRDEGTRLAARLDALSPLPDRPAFGRASLARDEALLELFRGASGTQAFFVRRDGPVRCGQTAAALLDAPALQGVRHVSIVDGGVRLDPTVLRRLLRDATLSFVPSASWLLRPASETNGAPLVVGDPRRDLPGARDEARAVAKTLSAELLEGDAATLEAVLARWAGRPVLHFAGHGRLAVGAPWSARLELAGGQALDFELLLSRRPGLGLVVLSGCETGFVPDAPADGIGLAEGFLAAGASHVLATVTELPDAQAGAFVERFYRHGGARDPAAAFRRAALEAEGEGDLAWLRWRLLGARR